MSDLLSRLKPCKFCGKIMPRKRVKKGKRRGRIEDWSNYKRRVYCSQECFQKKQAEDYARKNEAVAEEAEQERQHAERDQDIVAQRLGLDWLDWSQRVKAQLGFDPAGFYRIIWSGEFEVNFQTSSGEGMLGIQPFFPRGSQEDWYLRVLDHRRAATDPAYRKKLEAKDPEYWVDRRIGRFNKLVVKSRRIGFTTGNTMLALGDGTANRGWGTVITAYSDDGLTLISEISRTALGRDKEVGKAKGMALKRMETNNDSVVRFLGPKDSLGRGGGFELLIVSEAGYIEDLEGALDSVLPSIGKSPMNMVVLESTMRAGATSGYKEFVKRSMRGETDYEVIFLGWMQDDTAVLEPTDGERKYLDSVKAMNATTDIELYIVKIKRMGATLQQMTWWYQRLKEDARGRLGKMKEMYPSTLEEALENAVGDEYYTKEAIEYYDQQPRPPVARYKMDCKAEPPMTRLADDLEWENTPHMGLWWAPESETEYYIVCDPGTGKKHGGENYATVWERDTGRMVAEFHSTCSVYRFTNAAAQMGYYYNTALIVVENNKDGGMIEGLNIRLKYPLSRLYHMERLETAVANDQNAIGYTMTSQTRGWAIDRLRQCVNEMRMIIPSQTVWDQIKLTGDRRGKAVTGQQKMKNPDDGAMTTAIACVIRDYSSRWPSRTREDLLAILKKPQEIIDDEPRESVNVWTPGTYRKLAHRQTVSDSLRRIRGG